MIKRATIPATSSRDEVLIEKGVTGALENVSLFSQCSKRELKLVAKLAKVKPVPEGTVIVTEGEAGDATFVIVSGTAVVHKNGRKIAEVGEGDTIGELAALTKTPRNATVTAKNDMQLAVIGRRELHRLLEEAPGFSRKLLEALADRVRELDRRLVG